MSLADLFPDLPADILRDFDSPTSGGPDGGLNASGERGQVTDDQVAAYLQSIGSLRAPLPQLVEGQQAPLAPEFHNNGRIAPPANSATIEAPDLGDGLTPLPAQPPAAAPQAPPQAPAPTSLQTPPALVEPAQPPASTTSPPPVETPPAPGAPAPTSATSATDDLPLIPESPSIQSAAPSSDLQALLSDPGLRAVVANYLTGRTTPSVPGAPGQGPTQQQYLPPPPAAAAPVLQPAPPANTPQFDEFTDPAIRQLYEQNTQLQHQLNTLAQYQESARQDQVRVQMEHFTNVVNGAVTSWGEKYSIPADVLLDVRQMASRMGAAATYMNGTHPITGLPVAPDPVRATEIALDIAYHSTPTAIELERTRALQRAQQDATRRARLGGVGGSSASVPRSQPAPTTSQGRRQAMIDEVAEYLRGEGSPS